jgi:ubiquinone/menaquinone biosynthesis C-methylase UbiE
MGDAQAKINKLWDGASKEYDAHSGHGMQTAEQIAAWSAALRSMLPRRSSRVLDVGCGTGVIALLVADLGHTVVGVDLSEGMLAKAREKSRGQDAVTFIAGDAIDPPGDPASFDAVVNRHVLWTMTDPPRALANWHRLLRPGGRLAIVDGLWGKEPDDRMNDIAPSLPLIAPAITTDDIRALVKRAGFTSVKVSTLDDVDRIEHALQADDELWQPHYAITARKPK